MSRGFTLSTDEDKKASKFIKRHDRLHAGDQMIAIGGRYTYCLTPTGIGTIVVISCSSCGKAEDEDLTNYSAW